MVQLIHNQATIFSTPWFVLKVDQNRFLLETAHPAKAFPLRDLALSTFQILEHTPIDAFGFNVQDDYLMPNEEAWHNLGHQLAPKAVWNGLLQKPGMGTLIIKGKREDCPSADYDPILAEPSPKFGVVFSLNQH